MGSSAAWPRRTTKAVSGTWLMCLTASCRRDRASAIAAGARSPGRTKRLGTFPVAATALRQIEAALEVMRAGGHAPDTAYYESRLPEARVLVDRLKMGAGTSAVAEPNKKK